MKPAPLSFLLAALTLAPGCADEIGTSDPDAAALPDGGDDGSQQFGPLTHTDHGDGSTTTVVDASAMDAWVYVSFTSDEPLEPADPATSGDWDLAFQRYTIQVDGGVSGTGGVEVAILDDVSLEEITAAPAQGYVTDAPDSDDEDTDPDLAFTAAEGGWFEYDPMTHVLSPRDRVYVVRAVSGEHYKLRILDYYDEAGTSGHLQFRWAPVAAPAGSRR